MRQIHGAEGEADALAVHPAKPLTKPQQKPEQAFLGSPDPRELQECGQLLHLLIQDHLLLFGCRNMFFDMDRRQGAELQRPVLDQGRDHQLSRTPNSQRCGAVVVVPGRQEHIAIIDHPAQACRQRLASAQSKLQLTCCHHLPLRSANLGMPMAIEGEDPDEWRNVRCVL